MRGRSSGDAAGLNLCQPGTTSCGACCGLYNFRRHSREALGERLARRTARLREVPRRIDLWMQAAQQLRFEERGGRPATLSEPELPCPLLGFLDPERKRIGCLGHPFVTGGVDLRDCGNFGPRACSSFFCDAWSELSAAEAELVRRCCDDWYLYGLVITDPPYLRGCLTLVGDVAPTAVLGRPEAVEAFAALLALKVEGVARESSPQVLGRAPELVGLGPEARVLTLLGCRPDDADAGRELRRRAEAVRAALDAGR